MNLAVKHYYTDFDGIMLKNEDFVVAINIIYHEYTEPLNMSKVSNLGWRFETI
jgi:hypothetical protein